MTWPDPVTIERESNDDTVDATYKQPTGIVNDDPIYEGYGRAMEDTVELRRANQGDDKLRANGAFYLPAGEHDIRENDIITSGEKVGRVRRVKHFTARFFTRLFVRWGKVRDAA